MVAGSSDVARIGLLAVDIDGTLVADQDRVSPATRAALHRAAARMAVVLATGRRYRTTRRVIDALGLALPAVCLGGALIKDAAGATLDARAFAPAQLAALVALARRRRLSVVLQRDAHARGGADFVIDSGSAAWNEPTQCYVRMGGADACRDDAPQAAGYDDVLVVGCFGDAATLDALQREVRALSDEFSGVLVPSQRTPGWYLEVLRGGVDKWSGLTGFMALSGLTGAGVCAVGDAANDLSMLRGATIGVAMGNAPAELKAAADWVVASQREDGVAALVDRLLRGGAGAADGMTGESSRA